MLSENCPTAYAEGDRRREPCNRKAPDFIADDRCVPIGVDGANTLTCKRSQVQRPMRPPKIPCSSCLSDVCLVAFATRPLKAGGAFIADVSTCRANVVPQLPRRH